MRIWRRPPVKEFAWPSRDLLEYFPALEQISPTDNRPETGGDHEGDIGQLFPREASPLARGGNLGRRVQFAGIWN